MDVYFDLWNASVVQRYSVTKFLWMEMLEGGIKKTFSVIECETW